MKMGWACLCALSLAMASGFGKPPTETSTPEKAVRAFAAAVQRQDMKAVVDLVVGGKKDSKLTEVGSDPGTDYRVTGIALSSIKSTIKGDRATVTFRITWKTDEDAGPYSETEPDSLRLRLIDGRWMILPPGGCNFGALEEAAYRAAHPEEFASEVEYSRGEPAVNSEPQRKLGQERARLFQAALDSGRNRGPELWPSYSGYGVMFDSPRTVMLWPLGKGDEVFFWQVSRGGEYEGSYLTCWRRVAGKPKRAWQIKLRWAGRHVAPRCVGTLGKWLGREGFVLPKRASKGLTDRTRKVEMLAAYYEVPVIEDLHCWVVRANGEGDSTTVQDFTDNAKAGFFITPEEAKAMKARAR